MALLVELLYARIRRLDESAEVIMFERGPYVSFSNCGLPFHLSKMVEKAQDAYFDDTRSF